MKTIAKYVGLFLLGFCIGYTGFSLALAQEEPSIQPEAVTPAEPDFSLEKEARILTSEIGKRGLLDEIIATSSIEASEAMMVFLQRENNQEIVSVLNKILGELRKIEKNTR